MDIVFLFIGLLIGFAAAWFIVKSQFAGKQSALEEKSKMAMENERELKLQLNEKEDALRQMYGDYKSKEAEYVALEDKLKEHKQEMEKLQEQFTIFFKNLSNDILEEKSKKFLELNEKNVTEILKPLREKILDFEKKVDETYKEEVRERISLKEQLKHIVELNKQVSDDATKLTNALKGDKKLLGDWGEVQLEMILEKAGLEKDIHYQKQANYKDDSGNNQRPDYIVNMPENKNLILDSKVSLVAYEKYYNAEEDKDREPFLREYLGNLHRHIKELGDKNYPKLYGINPPDYVLMFFPIEPALSLALREDLSLFEKALEKNVVLVSTSTLLATLRTISFIWKQENQRNNVVEIARQSGALYEKFVGFMNDLVVVGNKIDDAKDNYSLAMNKLFTSAKKGDTIIGRIEKIKELGADTNKSLPQNILDRLDKE